MHRTVVGEKRISKESADDSVEIERLKTELRRLQSLLELKHKHEAEQKDNGDDPCVLWSKIESTPNGTRLAQGPKTTFTVTDTSNPIDDVQQKFMMSQANILSL